MKTILDVLNLSAQFLEQKGFSDARRQAQDVISRALAVKPIDLYLNFERPLNETELEKCRTWLARRGKREPAAYIEGSVEFLDCAFNVSKDVLIPRQETEILASMISGKLAGQDLEGKVLLDLCAGSGCLGISLKHRFPALTVLLSDVSASALCVAADNAKKNAVEVELLQGDLLAPLAQRRVDFVVCNPPYISESEHQNLEADVREFEPREALVGGKTGLEFYERLAKELPSYLKRPAQVWLEIGGTQGPALEKMFEPGIWKTRQLEKDWAGWDRFFFLEIE